VDVAPEGFLRVISNKGDFTYKKGRNTRTVALTRDVEGSLVIWTVQQDPEKSRTHYLWIYQIIRKVGWRRLMLILNNARTPSPRNFPSIRGRFKSDGPYSGEAFREEVLKPLLEKCPHITIVLSGANGYGASFLENLLENSVRFWRESVSRAVDPSGR